MEWVVNAMPLLLYPQEYPGIHCLVGWVGLRTSQDGCGKSPQLRFNPQTINSYTWLGPNFNWNDSECFYHYH